tara:strand:- start:6 stop:125 length:120 start_codon:yes stop_codon:yes gene_type:complete
MKYGISILARPKKRRKRKHSKNASKGQVGYKKKYRGQGK